MAKDIYKWLFGARGRDAVRAPLPLMPERLQPHAAAIAATVRPIISVDVVNGPSLSATGSQLGGRPWWPRGRPYPKDKDGQPLFLLIQLNFADMPALEPFPRTGLLQLFISQAELYGANLDDLQHPDGFACVYHDDLAQPVDTTSAPHELAANGYLPLEEPLAARGLTFFADQMVVDPTDYRFETLLPNIVADDDLVEAYAEWTSGAAAVSAIRLGGYPTFTQQDPRAFEGGGDLGDMTLLTIDSTMGIMWGDSGVAQFFMHERDLKRLDFSRVAYNWDCC